MSAFDNTNDTASSPVGGASSPQVVPPYSGVPAVPVSAGGVALSAAPGFAPVGKVRDTGTCILLMIVTLGFYSLYWYYSVHEEMKRHTGQGLGGGVALLIGLFVSFVMAFISPSEVGGLYTRRGQQAPVSGATGLWMILLGWFFGLGAIVWFVKTNGALNAYWRSVGA